MIVCYANHKGGVGKTTATVFLSQYFAFIRGKRTLVIDAEPQANATRALMGADYRGLLLEHIVLREERNIDNIITHTNIPNLDILPSSASSDRLETLLLADRVNGDFWLENIINDYLLRDRYNMIMIDTTPQFNILTMGALIASDYVIVPLENKIYAKEGYSKFFNTVEQMRRGNKKVRILGAFINRYETRSSLSKAIVKSYEAGLNDILFNTKIPNSVIIEECVAFSKNLFTYGHRPTSNAFDQLGTEIHDRIEALSSEELEVEHV